MHEHIYVFLVHMHICMYVLYTKHKNIVTVIQIGPVVTDSKTGRTINDIIKDLISEVDDGTLTLLVTEKDETSQPQDEVSNSVNNILY